ncbi:transposase [Spirosoma sordidisoli]|uniref:Transposase n=1 Tax=Spirosoma sordidisoli TaxID=2502893 RepID=A0A4Q2UMF3_9BACT|nr:transposase [Spirosoma sordidisoli]RYC68740.1 transposase [Spirosoma sordidisoli]
MKINSYAGLAVLVLAVSLTGCGNKEEEKKDEASVSAMGTMDAMKEMAAQAEEMGKNGPVETVDFRSLKELLPEEADGLTRKEATGEKNGAAGFTVSTANGKYANSDESETIEISLVDGGGSAMMMGLAAWSMIEVDKETENGYEKTSTMGGNKTYEKYDNADKSGEIAMLVNKRFIVTAKGRGVSMEKLKATLDDVDLAKLASLK